MPAKYRVGEKVRIMRDDGKLNTKIYEIAKSYNNMNYHEGEFTIYTVISVDGLSRLAVVKEEHLQRHYEYPGNVSDILIDKYMDYIALYDLFNDEHFLDAAEEYRNEWFEMILIDKIY